MTTSTTDTSYRAGNSTAPQQRLSTETKASTKTTEFFVFLAAVAAVVITAVMVGQDENTGIDPFGALDAIQYITFLSLGDMVARGLATSGSRETSSN